MTFLYQSHSAAMGIFGELEISGTPQRKERMRKLLIIILNYLGRYLMMGWGRGRFARWIMMSTPGGIIGELMRVRENANPRDGNQENVNPRDGNQENANPRDGNQENASPENAIRAII
jgi:hypothetical protein